MSAASGKIRKGRPSRKTYYFCEKHFPESDLIRSFDIVLPKNIVRKIPRDVIKLKSSAVPSIFDSVPASDSEMLIVPD